MYTFTPTHTRMETKGMDRIKHIARANNFPHTLTQKLDSQLQHTLNSHNRDNDNPKY